MSGGAEFGQFTFTKGPNFPDKRGRSPGEAAFVDAGADRVRRGAPFFPEGRHGERSAVNARAYRSARSLAPLARNH